MPRSNRQRWLDGKRHGGTSKNRREFNGTSRRCPIRYSERRLARSGASATKATSANGFQSPVCFRRIGHQSGRAKTDWHSASRKPIRPGEIPRSGGAIFAGSVIRKCRSPRYVAATICRAAAREPVDSPGSESLMLNQAYSARCCPLNSAFRGLPVASVPGKRS